MHVPMSTPTVRIILSRRLRNDIKSDHATLTTPRLCKKKLRSTLPGWHGCVDAGVCRCG